MAIITFKPKVVTKRFLSGLQDRSRDVLVSRLGLGDDVERKTLEAIGQNYGITRERVRQIENAALTAIRKSESYKQEEKVFSELREALHSLGGVLEEEDLLDALANDQSSKNHIYLLLVLGDPFTRHKEDSHFKHRWSIDDEIAMHVHNSLRDLHDSFTDEDLVPEEEMISRVLQKIEENSKKKIDEETARRFLTLSKMVRKNPLNDWGLASSPSVNVRGVRDYAFLVIRKHGSPMHFTEVSKSIKETFGRPAHTATCHNELIKDSRFVLVGRGLYALSEWGYASGVVRDVIREVLEKHGPLSREEIIEKVLKERYVKENTIFVNLQDNGMFRKGNDGKYALSA